MPFAQTSDGRRDTRAELTADAAHQRTVESSTQDQDDLAVVASAQSAADIAGMSLCSCEYYRIVTEEMSHFAVMPEKLVEPCVLAGTKPGDTVLDPFCGSGTVGAVAVKYQRGFVGIDLNPAYLDLATARIRERLAQGVLPLEVA